MNSLVIGLLVVVVIVVAAFLVYSYYPNYSATRTAVLSTSSTSTTTTIAGARPGPFLSADGAMGIFQANATGNWGYSVNYCNAANASLSSNASVCSDTGAYMMNISRENFTGWVVQYGSFGVLNFREILLYHDKNSTRIYNNFVGYSNVTNSTINATENGAFYSIILNSSLFSNKIAVLKGDNLALVTAGGLQYNQTYNARIVSIISNEI